jgi:hypothetical protein
MSDDDWVVFLREAAEEAKRFNETHAQPVASVYVSAEGNAMDVSLDNSRSKYGEWIAGEGADVSLDRDQDTRKVCGARLPLYAKTLVVAGDNFGPIVIDLETGAIEDHQERTYGD